MASPTLIVAEIMREIGKSGPSVRSVIETKVGDVTVDLLSQNEGRFKALEDLQSISILTTTREYKLNADFNTAKQTFYEVDDDGDFKSECTVTTKSNIHRRKAEGRYAGYRICYIKRFKSHTGGMGYYLVLADDAPEATTFELDYYRKPTRNDADIIENVDIIKMGVKGSIPQYVADSIYSLEIYERMKRGFRENPEKFAPRLVMMPSRKIAKLNRRMHNIGQGG